MSGRVYREAARVLIRRMERLSESYRSRGWSGGVHSGHVDLLVEALAQAVRDGYAQGLCRTLEETDGN